MNDSTCISDGCESPARTRGMCGKHYARFYRATRTQACSVGECDRKAYAKGLCSPHYQRLLKYGAPDARPPRPTTAQRLAEGSRRDGDCITWTGNTSPDGYGRIRLDGAMPRVHRVAWSLEHGAIPEGVEIDHSCWNRACINVEHLRLASRAENVRSREGANANSRTGVRGVYWDAERQSYRAQVGRRYLGRFDNIEDAAGAVASARAEAYGDFAGN